MDTTSRPTKNTHPPLHSFEPYRTAIATDTTADEVRQVKGDWELTRRASHTGFAYLLHCPESMAVMMAVDAQTKCVWL